MDVVLASDVTMLIYKDSDWRPFVCATDLSIDFSMEVKEVRTIGDGKWKKPRGQSLTYTLSLSGIITLVGGDPTAFYVLEFYRQMIPLNFRIIWDDVPNNLQKIAEGWALPVNIRLPSGAEGFANANIEMRGDGECEIKDATVTCTATIDTVVVGPYTPEGGTGGEISVDVTGISSNTERIEWSIDGSGTDAIITGGVPNVIFYPTGNYSGSHTILVYPVCENGEYGVPIEIPFTR